MSCTQILAPAPSRPGAIPDRTTGLADLRRKAYQCGLGYLWKDFEAKLPELFVDNESESRVGIAIEERDRLDWVSNPKELCTALDGEETWLL